MFAAKKATASDVELVVPRINWTANAVFINNMMILLMQTH
jgi:hypothetical protein